eukprot:CAMPEP_0197176428 /NCGR_PEP_ID=MMETSP1423-20130617/2366_1 /TAXON_ID=476441 /ORGANISM="Pseudo-nitzschia heimii, Strain UNC1101" /LENGTH=459 /DNA_ID=CAMNT_0042625809 /DNA_START=134 /DNA_END=1513 /DNA_ORIENTATION=-
MIRNSSGNHNNRKTHREIAISIIAIIAIACLRFDPNDGGNRRHFVADGFAVPRMQQRPQRHPTPAGRTTTTAAASSSSASSSSSSALGASSSSTNTATTNAGGGPPAPVLNGKRILPVKIMTAGLRGHVVAAAYAVMSRDFKTKGDWESCQHVGITTDLGATLKGHVEEHGRERAAHIRALSFVIPSESAMESIAADWRKLALESEGGMTNFDPILAAMDVDDFLDDDDDDDDDDRDFDDDDDDDYFEMMAGAIAARSQQQASPPPPSPPAASEASGDDDAVVSPFDDPKAYATTTEDGDALEFTKENVDKVLDEIRPYLISDGGNVSVDRIDEKTKSVYLVLEGACGSCPSSTVTMQMGIERVLKENFADLGEVARVDPDDEDNNGGAPKELTYVTVEKEVNRIKPAIIAMGGAVTILEVDPIGTVKLRFRGANKVRQGLEMALLDIDFVKHVDFVMD